jgi:hypothetical protein
MVDFLLLESEDSRHDRDLSAANATAALRFVDARRDDRAPEAMSVLPRFRVAQRQKPTRKTCE